MNTPESIDGSEHSATEKERQAKQLDEYKNAIRDLEVEKDPKKIRELEDVIFDKTPESIRIRAAWEGLRGDQILLFDVSGAASVNERQPPTRREIDYRLSVLSEEQQETLQDDYRGVDIDTRTSRGNQSY